MRHVITGFGEIVDRYQKYLSKEHPQFPSFYFQSFESYLHFSFDA